MQETIVIEPGRSERHYWRDLWHYRELFVVLARRDLSVRYKQTAIGVLWALLRPLLAVAIFTIIFGRIAKLPSVGTVPYPLLVFVGMLPWNYFANSLVDASNSLISSANLISKVYFPRLIVPSAMFVVAMADFLVNCCILVMFMIWYRFVPSWEIVFLPAFLVLACVASFGPALWIASLNVKYRDLRFVTPFLIQFGLYLSPVGFSSDIIPEQWRLIYSLNPMVGVIDGFRWCLLGGQSKLYLPGLAAGICVAAFFLWFGINRFRKTEKSFADLI